MNIRAPKDFWSGIMFIAFAAVAMLTARGYSLGSAGRMGPGYFPMLLGGALGLLGFILVARSLVIEGETIEDRVRRQGPIDCATTLDIILQITRALIAAGGRKFVHRDVKPSNIMLCTEADGAIVAKLIDFGLSEPLPINRGVPAPVRAGRHSLAHRILQVLSSSPAKLPTSNRTSTH